MAVSKFSGHPCKIRHIFNVSWVLRPTREYSRYEFYILKDQFWEVVCLKGKKRLSPTKSSTSHNETKPQISIPTDVLCRRWRWTLRLSIYFGKSRSPSRQSNAPPRANQNASYTPLAYCIVSRSTITCILLQGAVIHDQLLMNHGTSSSRKPELISKIFTFHIEILFGNSIKIPEINVII